MVLLFYEPYRYLWKEPVAGELVWTGASSRSIALVTGGIAGLWGLTIAYRRMLVAERDYQSKILADCLRLLADEKMFVRNAAVSLLGQLYRSYRERDDKVTVGGLLVEFVHEKSPLKCDAEGKLPEALARTNRLDVEKALKLISSIEDKKMLDDDLDYSNLDFRKLDCGGINFPKVYFYKTDLRGADLSDAKNLTQGQLDVAFYEKEKNEVNSWGPPKLPQDLHLPPEGAFLWVVGKDLSRTRSFVNE